MNYDFPEPVPEDGRPTWSRPDLAYLGALIVMLLSLALLAWYASS